MAAPATAPILNTTLNFRVLAHERQAEFDRTLASFRAEHKPVTAHQAFLVRQLAVSQWLLNRAQRFESRAFDHLAGAAPDSTDPDSRIVAKLFETNPNALAQIQRLASQAEKSYYRAWRELKTSQIQNEAKPVPVARPTSEPPNKRNEPNPVRTPFNPAQANPAKTKPSLRSQMSDNLALCL